MLRGLFSLSPTARWLRAVATADDSSRGAVKGGEEAPTKGGLTAREGGLGNGGSAVDLRADGPEDDDGEGPVEAGIALIGIDGARAELGAWLAIGERPRG